MRARKRYEAAWERAEELGVTKELAEIADRVVATLPDAEARYDSIRWGQRPSGVLVLEAPEVLPGQTLTILGQLEYVEYLARKNGPRTLWQHPFKRQKPKLCVNHEGKLIIAGGDYEVTDRGIVG